jgi:hypothetical protein
MGRTVLNQRNHTLDDDEIKEEARIKAVQANAMMERAKVKAAASAARLKEEEHKKAEEARIKAEQDAADWAKTKELVAQRQAAAAAEELKAIKSGGDAVLLAIEKLAMQAIETEQQVERAKRLEKVLGEEAVKIGKRARQRSKDLMDEIARMMEGNLESAFMQFDKDGSGTLDAQELAAAYAAAGMPIDENKLVRCMKVLDTNGDGVIDLEEFKSIAVKLKTMAD